VRAVTAEWRHLVGAWEVATEQRRQRYGR